MDSDLSADDYAVLFRRLLRRNVALALAEVTGAGWQLQPGAHDRLLFVLANALRLPSAWPDALQLLTTLAPRLEQAGLRTDWLPYLERGIACCDISGDGQTAAQLALERGILLERLGRLAEAQAALTDAAGRFAAAGDQRGQAKAHNRLAYVLRGRDAAAAAQHVAQAQALLAAAQAAGTPAGADCDADSELMYCHLAWGLLACHRQDWPTAEEHLRQCAAGWRTGGEQRLYGMALINLAAVYISTARYPQAVDNLAAALAVLAALEDKANAALVHLNLGVVHLFLQQWETARAELLIAEPVFRQLQDEQRLALVYSNLALAEAALGRRQEAERSFEAAITRFTVLEDFPNAVDTQLDLAELHLQHGQGKAAHACVRQAQTLLTRIPYANVRDFQRSRVEHILAAAGAPSAGVGQAP